VNVVRLQEIMVDIVTATLFIMKCGIPVSCSIREYVQMFSSIKEFEEGLNADRTFGLLMQQEAVNLLCF
jgi:hypothetical protein